MLISMIVTFYQGTQTERNLLNLFQDIARQSKKVEHEILVYHDGPLFRRLPPIPDGVNAVIKNTPTRFNDYGHSLRDIGIYEARGEYILHTNADNRYYPHCFEVLTSRMPFEIAIFAIIMKNPPFNNTYFPGVNCEKVSVGVIDAMQVAIKRQHWIDYGGWKNKHHSADGMIYEQMVTRHPFIRIEEALGEHH